MGFFKNLVSGARKATESVTEVGKDFHLDVVLRDDADLAARIYTGVASIGGYDDDERQLVAAFMEGMLDNYDRGELGAFLAAAEKSYVPMHVWGVRDAVAAIERYVDDRGNLDKILEAAVALAELGGIDDKERALLTRFITAAKKSPAEFGL